MVQINELLKIEQQDAPKKVIKKLSTLTLSSGQTGWEIFRKLILFAIHWRIKL